MIFNLSFSQKRRLSSTFSKPIKLVISLILAFVLQACATKPPQTQDITSVSQLSNWNARGKLLLKNNKDKLSGYFFWQQKQNGEFKLVITSFIGTNLLTLNNNNEFTELKLDGETYTGEDPELLIYKLTGSYIPVRNMANWMLAQAPERAEKVITNNTLTSFTWQDASANDWNVKYKSYKKVSSVTLPEKVTIEGLNNRIKLTINEWEFLAP